MITDNKCILLSNKIKTIQTFGLTCGTSRYKTPTGIANELLVIGPYILHLYAPNSQTRLLYRKSDFCRFMHLGIMYFNTIYKENYANMSILDISNMN